MDAAQIRKAVALGELLELARSVGMAVHIDARGSVTMADGSIIAAGVEEALSMLRDMTMPHSSGLLSHAFPAGLPH
jgi:hypothetical protein